MKRVSVMQKEDTETVFCRLFGLGADDSVRFGVKSADRRAHTHARPSARNGAYVVFYFLLVCNTGLSNVLSIVYNLYARAYAHAPPHAPPRASEAHLF